MVTTAGIDQGSTYVKAAVLQNEKRVGHGIMPTGAYPDKSAMRALATALKMARLRLEDIDYAVSTGYGRRIARIANQTISEISANARGSKWLGREKGIRTIIDIGGQDTKVISLDDECNILNFAMNDKCAAGTGRFLEILAKVLDVPLDDMGRLSLSAERPVEITTTCLVFAKSEVASLIAQGHGKEDIIAGIHRAVARRLLVMARGVGVRREVFFDGGPARNIGMIRTLEGELGFRLCVPDEPQVVTATGAALIAQEILSSQI